MLLVDDVMTSGATASACARALKAAGAAGVDVLAAARVPNPLPVACETAGVRRNKRDVTKETELPEVEIYTQPWCAYCARAKRLLDAKGVAFREIEAPHGTPERAEASRRSGGRTTVPQIFIGGRHIGGCDELMALDAAGKLDAMLRAA